MMHVIVDEMDVAYLKSLRDRLYSEKRMTSDDMRDAGNQLWLLIGRLVEIDEKDLP